MSGLKVVRAGGEPRTRGEQIGRELREEVTRSVEFYHRYFERRGISSEQLQELLTPYLLAAETHLPSFVSVLKGMSIGATVPVLELFAINAFEELEPLLTFADGRMLFLERKEGFTAPARGGDRCSSFVVTADGSTILAHNEHWLVGDAGNVAVVVDAPSDRPVRVASPTVVCCLPAVGVNSHGVGQGIASLSASDDRVGVPRVLVSRSSLESRDATDALARAGMSPRSGGYGHTFAFRGGGSVVIETTAERLAVVEGPPVHTNHYLDPELTRLGPAPSVGSSVRHARIVELLQEREPVTVPDVMDILRDHATEPQAICQHADPAEGDEADAVLFSMVAELESGRMWVAPGNPCETEYDEIDLGDLR
jgi:Acyl-coenzyme A:6-aminopenicillanic acid acyl-transferase